MKAKVLRFSIEGLSSDLVSYKEAEAILNREIFDLNVKEILQSVVPYRYGECYKEDVILVYTILYEDKVHQDPRFCY